MAQLYAERSGLTGNKDDLDAATGYVKRAIDISQDDSQFFKLLNLDADLAFVKYTQSNEAADLEVALEKNKGKLLNPTFFFFAKRTKPNTRSPNLTFFYKIFSSTLYNLNVIKI